MIARRDNVRATTKADGYPAWKATVSDQLADPGGSRRRYRRRAGVEGAFGAFNHRFGAWVRARHRDARRVETLARVVVWNAVALSYEGS